MLPITRGVNLHAFTSHNSPKQSLRQHPVDFCWTSCSWNLVSHFEGLKFGYFTIWNVEEPGNMRSNTKTSTPWGILWTFIFSTQHQGHWCRWSPLRPSPFYSWKNRYMPRLTTLTTFWGARHLPIFCLKMEDIFLSKNLLFGCGMVRWSDSFWFKWLGYFMSSLSFSLFLSSKYLMGVSNNCKV